MTTYTDEVNIYNPDAISDAIDDAGNAYKTYITEVTSDGIMVAAAGKGTSNGSIVSTTTGWHLSDVLEWVRNGISRFWIGLKESGDTTPTVRIGKAYNANASDNESHMELDFHSLKLIDKNGNKYLHVSDLRDEDGFAEITDVFIGDGSTYTFTLSFAAYSTNYTVKVDGTTVSSGIVKSQTTVVFNDEPAYGAEIEVVYQTVDSKAKAFTFGTRASGATGGLSASFGQLCVSSGTASFSSGNQTEATGSGSFACGYLSTASGEYAHAEGWNTTASERGSHSEGRNSISSGWASHSEGADTIARGRYSHAQNYKTKAYGTAQTVIGKYNDTQTTVDTFTVDGNEHWTTEFYLSAVPDTFISVTVNGIEREYMYASALNLVTIVGYSPPSEPLAEDTIRIEYTTAASTDYAFVIGNGTSDNARSNALTADWSGSAQLWHPDIERGTAPSSSIYGSGGTLQLVDKDGHQIGYLQPIQLTNGTEGIQLGVSNSDSTDWNTIDLGFDANDNPTVSVSYADKWRNALGILDSGWQTLTLGSAAKAYDSGTAPEYRKCFNVVNLVGAVSPKSQVAAGGSFDVGQLPSGYRPKQRCCTVCQGSGNSVYLLSIATGGTITIERYRNGASANAAMSTTTWLPFNVTFICE